MLANTDLYNEIINNIIKTITNNFEERKSLNKVCFEDITVELTNGNLITILILLKPYLTTDIKINSTEVPDVKNFSSRTLNKYINNTIQDNRLRVIKTKKEISKDISEILNSLAQISGLCTVLKGITTSVYDFLEASAKDPYAYSLFNTKIGKGLQFNEVEDKFKELGDKITDYFKTKPEYDLYYHLNSNAAVNIKQLTQATGFVGAKPDMDGNHVPVIIEDNYLVGLSDVESYFVNSKGTRKALVVNYAQVRKSGYLTRKLSLACVDRYHDNDKNTCDTKHTVKFFVKDEKHLNRIIGRHYHPTSISDGIIRTITNSDTNLIGKTILLRSPVTCSDKLVCSTCYGKGLSETNKNLNTGILAVLLLTNPTTQKLLSSKHLLSTNTDVVEWGEDFSNTFIIDLNHIYFTDNETKIIIKKKNLKENEDEQIFVDKITIKNGKKEYEFKSPLPLFMSEEILDKNIDGEREVVYISSKKFDLDEPIFTFQPNNNEISASLQKILDLIESSEHLGILDYNDFVNKFVELLIENDLNISSVHAEMITSVLIRDLSNNNNRPDFTKGEIDNYEILRVSKAILNGPLSTSLAFERISDQLANVGTYLKSNKSLLDELYK